MQAQHDEGVGRDYGVLWGVGGEREDFVGGGVARDVCYGAVETQGFVLWSGCGVSCCVGGARFWGERGGLAMMAWHRFSRG